MRGHHCQASFLGIGGNGPNKSSPQPTSRHPCRQSSCCPRILEEIPKGKTILRVMTHYFCLLRGPSLTTTGSHAHLIYCQREQSISQRKTEVVVPLWGMSFGLAAPPVKTVALIDLYSFIEHLLGQDLHSQTFSNHITNYRTQTPT